jgi:hypothetical protein
MSEVRRGSAAIQEAAKSSGGGGFRPFLPAHYWKGEEGEEKYLLFLNEVEDMPLFDMIQYIPEEVGDRTIYQETVAKTDPFFGEKVDAFEKQWDATIRKTNVAIAVELEPVVEVVNKRRKPRGFEVKTIEFERRILDEDGEATDETEEVTAPAVGYVAQSPNNFFNQISNYDANEAPITETALKIVRIGKDKTTSYQIIGYDELPIDLTNLVEYVEGISYLGDDLDGLIEEIEGLDTAEEQAAAIGSTLLEKREEELIDGDRYDELLEGVHESMDKYGNKKKKGGKKGEEAPRSRVASRRSKAKAAEAEAPEDGDEPDEPKTDPEPEEGVKPARKAKAKASKAKASTKQTPQGRMDDLRAKAAERAKSRK